MEKEILMEQIIRMIVNRRHVSETNRNVIRYVISRLKGGKRTYWKLSRVERREILRLTIDTHQDNRDTYTAIMTGRF